MYLLGIHCLIPSFVLWNPEEFSSRVKETKETAVFRAEKDAKAIRDYLLGSILRKAPARKPGSGPRPSLFWEEDVQTSAPSTSRTHRAASVWQEHESDDDNGEEDYEEEEHDFESREQFHETAPRDRGKRPASTSTDTTTSAKKKGRHHLPAGANPPLPVARSPHEAAVAAAEGSTFSSPTIKITSFQHK